LVRKPARIEKLTCGAIKSSDVATEADALRLVTEAAG
jgi:hypothetical protein